MLIMNRPCGYPQLYARGAVTTRAALGFLEDQFPVVGIPGRKQKGSSFVPNVGDLSHRNLLRRQLGDGVATDRKEA